MTWAFLVWLIRSMMQARVVDFPLPAAPVTNTMPFFMEAMFKTVSGIWMSAGFGRSKRTIRMTAAREPLCFITLARNRESPTMEKEKSSSPSVIPLDMSRLPLRV